MTTPEHESAFHDFLSNRLHEQGQTAAEFTISLSPEEQLAFWKALQEPPKLTPAQQRLGRLMRGES